MKLDFLAVLYKYARSQDISNVQVYSVLTNKFVLYPKQHNTWIDMIEIKGEVQ